eukprot:802632-Rhodomonas_salina.2
MEVGFALTCGLCGQRRGRDGCCRAMPCRARGPTSQSVHPLALNGHFGSSLNHRCDSSRRRVTVTLPFEGSQRLFVLDSRSGPHATHAERCGD